MNISDEHEVKQAVKHCHDYLENVIKTPGGKYNAAVSILLSTLAKNELYLGHKEMRMLCKAGLIRSTQVGPAAVSEAVMTLHEMLGTPRSTAINFPMEVLVNTIDQILRHNDCLLAPEHCEMLNVVPQRQDIAPTDSEIVDNTVNKLLSILENGTAGLSEEALEKLSKHVIHNNERTTGTIIDATNHTERYRINMPVMSSDLSNQVMDLVERLGNGGWHVDKRAWDHLLIYIPKYQKLKKRFKRFKRFFRKI